MNNKLRIVFISFILVVLFCATNTSVFAQETDKNYLFNEFQDATILFKAGGKTNVKMNYNIVYRQMVYFDNHNLLALSKQDIQSISKITIGDRIFIPFEKGICELISTEPYIVAEYSSIIKPERVNIGLGATTSTAPVSQFSGFISSSGNLHDLSNLTIVLPLYWTIITSS